MKNILLTIDTVGQAILLTLCLFFPLTLFVAVPLGGWQLLSSLCKGLLLQSKLHLYYFLSATAYCVLLAFSAKMELDFNWLEWAQYLWVILAVPPVVGAVWYFLQSMRDMEKEAPNKPEMV